MLCLGRGMAARQIKNENGADVFEEIAAFDVEESSLRVANVSETVLKGKSDYVRQVEKLAQAGRLPVIVICGDLEAEMVRCPQKERQAFLEDLGLREVGLHQLNPGRV